MKKKDGKLRPWPPGALLPPSPESSAAVSRALDERFGRNAILRGENGRHQSRPPPHRRAFEAMQDRAEDLAGDVRMQASQQIISERSSASSIRARGEPPYQI